MIMIINMYFFLILSHRNKHTQRKQNSLVCLKTKNRSNSWSVGGLVAGSKTEIPYWQLILGVQRK